MAQIKVLLFTAENESICQALKANGLDCILVNNAQEALASVSQNTVNLMVLEYGIAPQGLRNSLTQVNPAKKDFSGVPILFIYPPRHTIEQIDSALAEAGELDDYVFRPFQVVELVLRTKALLIRTGMEFSTASGQLQLGSNQEGKIIAVYSAKAGTGKTTIATNLSIELKKRVRGNSNVFIVDGNLQFGDIRAVMDIRANQSIYEVALNAMDGELINRIAQQHPSGVKVLIAPRHPTIAEQVPLEAIQNIFGLLQDLATFTIVDLPTAFDERTLAILELAHMIILVVTPDVAVVANTTMFLTMANNLNLTGKMSIVINHLANTELSPEQVESTLGYLPIASISNDSRFALQAANEGQPVVYAYQQSPITRDINQLAINITKKLGMADAQDEAESNLNNDTSSKGKGSILSKFFHKSA